MSGPDMVEWSERSHDLRITTANTFSDTSYDDRLWMLSCAGAQAEEAQTGRRGFENTQVLRHLFQMGYYEWAVHQKPAPATL